MDMRGYCSAVKARLQARLACVWGSVPTPWRGISRPRLYASACSPPGWGWYTGWNFDALLASMHLLSANWDRVAAMG